MASRWTERRLVRVRAETGTTRSLLTHALAFFAPVHRPSHARGLTSSARRSRGARMNLEELSHNTLLPRSLIDRVPQREKLILAFVLAFLEAQRLPAQLLVNGGYVRDLLLGKQPDDLDLSLCLRECPPEVTLATVMDGMHAFAMSRPELEISTVQIATILSDVSKDKNVDTAKAHLGVGSPPIKVEVDFMPTIGEETYDDSDRVPMRDVRGTPEQDALRRDLTIGAMLLEVTPADGSSGLAPREAAEALQWRLLDFYGGLADLRKRVLRSPYPHDRSAALVWAEVMRSPAEQRLATQLSIVLSDAAAPAAPDAAPAAAPDAAAPDAAASSPSPLSPRPGEELWVLQVVWWVKVLRDDPLRVLRALRFAAKLNFDLHPSFWSSVPFALASLQSKVAGARKSTELVKIAKAGRPALLDFLSVAFGTPLPAPADQPLVCLAPALFGGANAKGEAKFLSACDGFDAKAMRAATAALPSTLSAEETLGACLAAATYSCEMPPLCRLSVGGDGGGASCVDEPYDAADKDTATAVAAGAALEEVSAACDGLGASNEIRQGAETPLACVKALLQPPQPQGQHALFGQACGAPPAVLGLGGDASEVSASEFAALVHLWDTLKLDKIEQGKRPTGYLPAFALSLAQSRCDPATAARLEARLAVLSAPGPQISGKSLLGVEALPPHMRGGLVSQMHVLCRLRGEPEQLMTSEQLVAYLGRCGGLLDKLEEEWYVADDGGEAGAQRKRQLKPPYAQQKPPSKKNK